MLESTVEKAYCKRVKANGGRAYKFVSPGCHGVPDRLTLFPIPEEHRAIVAKYIYFAEIKAPGKQPRPEQIREHKRLRKLGFTVEVIDDIQTPSVSKNSRKPRIRKQKVCSLVADGDGQDQCLPPCS